jgi:hypothetical protein
MNPHDEAERLLTLARERDALSEESKGLVRIKGGIWPMLRADSKSKADAEMKWLCMDEGMREKEIRIELENIDSQMSAVKVWLRQQEMEARNQY